MNKVFLIGNLTRDPETAATATGKNVCRFSIATDRRAKDKDGNKIADFHSIVCFGQTAENCAKYLSKGRKVGVVGELQYSQYEKDGIKKTSTAIVANEVEFLSPAQHQEKLDDIAHGMTDYDGDLPF